MRKLAHGVTVRDATLEVGEQRVDPGGDVVLAHVGGDRVRPPRALVRRPSTSARVKRVGLALDVERVDRQRPLAELLERAGVLGEDEHAVPLR